MRKHRKKLTSLCVLAVAAMTACSSGGIPADQPASQGERKDGEPARSYANDPAELVIFGQVGNSEEVWNERFGNALKQKFPNYKFTYIPKDRQNTISNLIASGQTIDLVHDTISGVRENIIKTGLGQDLTELMKKHKVDMNRFEPNVFKSLSNAGKLYGYPLHDGGLVLYYNKDIFDKFGVPYPKDGMTWDQAIELGKRLTRYDGRQYIGLGVSIDHMLTMNPYSLPYVNSSTEKAAIRTEAYRKMVSKSIVEPTEASGYRDYLKSLKRTLNNNDFMKEKNVAMFVMNFYLQLQPDFETFNWDMVSLPTFGDLPSIGSQPYPNGLFLTSTSKYKDQGMEVLNYLVSDEFQTTLSKKGFVPVVKNEAVRKAFGQDSPFKDKNMIPAVFTNKPAAPIERYIHDRLVASPLTKQLARVMMGETDLNTALQMAEEEANKALEAENK
ncbi:ABC transporter substrate-binding protein [Paenibacillus solanacearum]|uniref:ABC transporter substrate-binding protein n=1 Tax=Paenibacillus solanacearum TaxID=2048548 RepID=UPI001C407C22|nr:ABC transporter substrate-binding protein [Paenibacillus solanacearum]